MSDLSAASGWIAGIALVAAMLPHQVRLIRLLLLVGGGFGVLYFAFAGNVGPELVLAIVFVAVNAARLYQLWNRARSGSMTSEERELFDHVMQIEDPSNHHQPCIWCRIED